MNDLKNFNETFRKYVTLMTVIILKISKNRGTTLPLEDTFFEKPQHRGAKLSPHSTPTAVLLLKQI